MSTLTEFLLARIAEDEEGAIWHHTGECDVWSHSDYSPSCDCSMPARVLAECEAKRRIVALHTPDHECTDGSSNYPGVFGAADGFTDCDTLKALASVYADHPDYDEAWRP